MNINKAPGSWGFIIYVSILRLLPRNFAKKSL